MEALAAAMLEEDTSDGGVTVGDWAVGEASSGGQKSREPPIPVGLVSVTPHSFGK